MKDKDIEIMHQIQDDIDGLQNSLMVSNAVCAMGIVLAIVFAVIY